MKMRHQKHRHWKRVSRQDLFRKSLMREVCAVFHRFRLKPAKAVPAAGYHLPDEYRVANPDGTIVGFCSEPFFAADRSL